MKSSAALLLLAITLAISAGCPLQPPGDQDPNDAPPADGAGDDDLTGPPAPGDNDGADDAPDDGDDPDDGIEDPGEGEGDGDDDLVGPPRPDDPDDPGPDDPDDVLDDVRVDFRVTFADTGDPVDNALITVRTLSPSAVVCSTFTSFDGFALCDDLIPGETYSVTAEATNDLGTSLVATEQFTPQGGLAVPQTLELLIFR